MTIGQHMMQARKNAKMTRVELSELSGVEKSTIYNLERDLYGARLSTAMCLADALEISLDEYIGRKKPR